MTRAGKEVLISVVSYEPYGLLTYVEDKRVQDMLEQTLAAGIRRGNGRSNFNVLKAGGSVVFGVFSVES